MKYQSMSGKLEVPRPAPRPTPRPTPPLQDWGQEEKGTTEDEMAEWHHRLNGCEFE